MSIEEQNGQSKSSQTMAFVLSLLAGLWMLGMGVMMASWAVGGEYSWMWGHGMMRGFYSSLWWPWFGAIAGALVLLGAVMLMAKPAQRRGWGILIIIVSALNFFVGMGGFVAGILGIIGGALAISNVQEGNS